jgi:hypothetical protein
MFFKVTTLYFYRLVGYFEGIVIELRWGDGNLPNLKWGLALTKDLHFLRVQTRA